MPSWLITHHCTVMFCQVLFGGGGGCCDLFLCFTLFLIFFCIIVCLFLGYFFFFCFGPILASNFTQISPQLLIFLIAKWKERKHENKIKYSLFTSGRHTFAHTCLIYNKRGLYSPKGYKNQKRGIIMKAITYRINLYTSIGKFRFDITDERGVALCIIVQSWVQ